MAKGYWIARVSVADSERYKAYIAANAVPFKTFGARFLVRAGRFENPEGTSRPRNIVIEFPSYEAALACYRSPEYQEALEHRLTVSTIDLVIVEGYDGPQPAVAQAAAPNRPGRRVTIEAKPQPITIDTATTAVIVVDMQNDFGSKGGMFERAAIDISGIRAAVAPTARVLDSARKSGIKVFYLKMAYRPDLSDLGAADSVNRVRHLQLRVGQEVAAPDGTPSRVLVRDTWSSDIVDELEPHADDVVLYKTRFSGFYETDLDERLRELGAKHLIITGCTTSICVDSTVRDAMFRDYLCVLLADCMSEPIGAALTRSNHEASLLSTEVLLGWVSDSDRLLKALSS